MWDCGSSDWSSQDCRGVILKPSQGMAIALTGGRDNGIHTGHPTHLGLQMAQTIGIVWDSDYYCGFPKLPTGYDKEAIHNFHIKNGYGDHAESASLRKIEEFEMVNKAIDDSQFNIEKYFEACGFVLPSTHRVSRIVRDTGLVKYWYDKKTIGKKGTAKPAIQKVADVDSCKPIESLPWAYFSLW